MDSEQDAIQQLSRSTNLDESTQSICYNPFCLSDVYHEWGACSNFLSNAEVQPLTLPVPPAFDHFEKELVDGCGLGVLEREREKTEQQPSAEEGEGVANQRFAPPKSEEEIARARLESIPKKTRQDTEYCIRLWNSWAENRKRKTGVTVLPLEDLDNVETLQHWLCRFVTEIRKKNGLEYPPNTLHHVVAGIMRHMRHNCGRPELDFFKDPSFSEFRASLDAEMKRLQSAGIGSVKKQAEPLMIEEEELLWQKKLLGDHNPQSLLKTMMFMNGLYFALRSGSEHQVRYKPSLFALFEKPAYLLYTEDISKNHPGGSKGRKQKPKVVVHHANTSDPSRCFVRLYKLYNKLCPPDRPDSSFYLSPLKRYTETSRSPVGHNTLKTFKVTCARKQGSQDSKQTSPSGLLQQQDCTLQVLTHN